MSRDHRQFLNDILDCCEAVATWCRGMDKSALFSDRKTRDAVLRNIELIGEAARHIPEEWKATQPAVPWSNIVGTRNFLAHVYFNVDPDIVWNIVTVELPRLKAAVMQIISNLDER